MFIIVRAPRSTTWKSHTLAFISLSWLLLPQPHFTQQQRFSLVLLHGHWSLFPLWQLFCQLYFLTGNEPLRCGKQNPRSTKFNTYFKITMHEGLFMLKIFYTHVSKPKCLKFPKQSLWKHYRHEWTP